MMEQDSKIDFSLAGKRALITGASRGLGLGISKNLAAHGAEVYLIARNPDELNPLAEEIRASGGTAHPVAMDLLDEEAFEDFIADAAPFDILVNNAGINYPNGFLDVTKDQYDAIFDLNLKAAFFLSQAVSRKMVDGGMSGSIINMSSQMGHVGAVNRTVYCGSKHAMEGWTKAMAIELGPHNIRVNTVCPTFIETPMTRPFFENPEFKTEVLSKIKLGRIGSIEDVTGAVLYLASDASALVTGSAIMVDGGWTAE